MTILVTMATIQRTIFIKIYEENSLGTSCHEIAKIACTFAAFGTRLI